VSGHEDIENRTWSTRYRGPVLQRFGVRVSDENAAMQKAFIQRSEQIVGDCVQISTDVEVYNDINKEQPPIPMIFDFKMTSRSAERGTTVMPPKSSSG
jgi:hypothetical protein